MKLVEVRKGLIRDVFSLSPGFSFDMLAFSRFFFPVHSYNADTTFYLTQIQDPVLSKGSRKVVSYLHSEVKTASLK